jgi:hypothetical protein
MQAVGRHGKEISRARTNGDAPLEWGKSLGLPHELIDELFAVIIGHSSRIQSEKT